MFTLVKGFLFSALPYEGSEKLVMIWQRYTEAAKQGAEEEIPLSWGVFSDLPEHLHGLEQVAGFASEFANVTGQGEPRRLHLISVTGDFFPLLRQDAWLGRTLGPEDLRPDAPPVVVLGYGFWRGQLGGDPGILGKPLNLGGREHAVVGVLPAGFHFSESLLSADQQLSNPVDLWAPLKPRGREGERGFHSLFVVGRLRAAVSLADVQEQAGAYTRWAAEQFPDTDRAYGLHAVALREQIFGPLRPALLALWAATGCVLLIACANLATLLLAQGQAARRDQAVRGALGATRWVLVRQGLLDNVMLSVVGGLLALPVAYAAVRIAIALGPEQVFRSYPPEMDLGVIGFTVAISLCTGMLFGALPVARASQIPLADALKQGSGNLSRRSRVVFHLLVVAQVALSSALLVATGLSAKSFVGLSKTDLDVRLERVVTFDLFLPFAQYRDTTRRMAFFHDLLEKIRTLPGVELASMNYALPFGGINPSNQFSIIGQLPLADGEVQSANLGLVDPDYFQTLGIPLRQGRFFTEADRREAPLVAIVDERMVDQYFGGQEVLGRQISIAGPDVLTIVGVVKAVKQDVFEATPLPFVYLPYQQRCYMFTRVAARTSLRRPADLALPLRKAVKELDEEGPVSNLSTLQAAQRAAMAPQRFALMLIAVFAAVALFLAWIGTYGVLSFLTRQRQREAAVRMALGAEPRAILWLVIRQGLGLTALGVALGLGLSVLGRQLLTSLIHQMGAIDLSVFGAVLVTSLLATFVAYYLPGRALSKVDPSTRLRAT